MSWLSAIKKPTRLIKISRAGLFAFLLLMFLVVSLVAIVLVQHQVRHLETESYFLNQQKNKLEQQWGQLLLEKDHLSALGRVDRIAKEELDMVIPDEQEVIWLEAKP